MKTSLGIGISVCAIAGFLWGVDRATRSDLFVVNVVNVSFDEQKQNSPLSENQIRELAGIGVGNVNLFELDLDLLEKRLLSNPWIKTVELRKHFPESINISVRFRVPTVLLNEPDGKLYYVDRDARVIAPFRSELKLDIPVLMNTRRQASDLIEDAVRIAELWESNNLSKISLLSSLARRKNGALEGIAIYRKMEDQTVSRPAIKFGQNIDETLLNGMSRLSKVFAYMSEHSVDAESVDIRKRKKIVVKTARGS